MLAGVNAAGNIYTWQNGSTLITGANSSNFTVHNTGNYVLTITTAAGCIGTSATTNVTVNAVPQPTLSFSGGVLGTDPFAGYQWYLNGVAISGATGQNWTPVHNGNYSVTVVNAAGCSSSAGPIPITSLGVTQISSAVPVQIYPNPARNAVHIAAPVVVDVQVKDVQGRVVLTGRHVQDIVIGSLDNGIYFIAVFNTDGRMLVTQKLVKE